MSIPVPLSELPETMTRFGTAPYLLTVGPDAVPHAASVTVEWVDGKLVTGAGRSTAANLRTNVAVALLWPPPTPGDYSLIVDGSGDVDEDGPQRVVRIQPHSAILHVTNRGF